MWTSKTGFLRTVNMGLQTNVPAPYVKLRQTADKATFHIPHITHRSAVTFHTFHSRSFRMPQFRILPTTYHSSSPNLPTPERSTDDAGLSKHGLLPYNAYCHNWLTSNFTASDSSSDERCFLKVLIVLQLTQLADSKFQLSITLLEKVYFLTFSLNLFLNSLWSCPPFCQLHLAGKIIQD